MFSLARATTFITAGLTLAACGSNNPAIVSADASMFASTIAMPAPVLLDDLGAQCTEPHTVCMTVRMPDTIPGPPTHLAAGYWKAVPVMTPAVARGTLESPPLVAGQTFRLKMQDGGITGMYFPVVLVFMPGGGDIIAVDNLDYTAEATQAYDLGVTPLNISETLTLVYGI